MTTKIDLPNHLSEYPRGKFGDKDGIVCLPSNSSLYFIVYEITRRRPAGKPTDNGNTEIRLPSPALSHQTGGNPWNISIISAKASEPASEAREYDDEGGSP